MAELQQRIESKEYKEAIATAAEESIRSASKRKVHQFVAVVVGALTASSSWAHGAEDVAAMIRDIAQLGEKDLKVLALLKVVHASAIETALQLTSRTLSAEKPGR